MKKLLGVLLLFVFSLFIAQGQPKVITYVDTLKQVTVSITSGDKKQLNAIDNVQLQLAKAVDNQTLVNVVLANSVKSFTSVVQSYTKEVEQRNKSDGKLISDTFGYSPEQVKHTMKVQRWLNFTLYLLCVVYVFYVTTKVNEKQTTDHLAIKLLTYSLYGFVGFVVLKWLMTLLLNGDYYVIKELINLYT